MQQATVNLFADMGAQPLTLQIGADRAAAAARRRRRTTSSRRPRSSPRRPPARTVGERQSRDDHRHGDRHGGGVVAGVEVSVDGGATWRAAQGHAGRGASTGRPARSAPPRSAAARSTTAATWNRRAPASTVIVVAGDCPCTSLWKPSTVPARALDVDDPSPVELGLKFTSDIDGFITGVRFYKGAGQHRHARRQPVDDRPARCSRRRPSRARRRPAGSRCSSTSPVAITANTTYVVSYHTNVGRYAADGGYLQHHRRRLAAAARAASRPRPAATASSLYGATRVPDADLQRHQLLGGRRRSRRASTTRRRR